MTTETQKSNFFYNASSKVKEKVFRKVIINSIKDQRKQIAKNLRVEDKFKIDELYKKSENAKNGYEKQMYFRKIRLLRAGRCPECERELEKNY